MDAISVGAESRGADREALDVDPVAAVELDVELGAVLDAEVPHCEV